jgi:hypothetical protein
MPSEDTMGEYELTLGVEEEYAIVHPVSRELKSHINTMMRIDRKSTRLNSSH